MRLKITINHLVNVEKKALVFAHLFNLIGWGDFSEGLKNIFCHPLGIAADIDMGAIIDPIEDFLGFFKQAVLDVDFFGLVAGKGCVEDKVFVVDEFF